MPTTAVDHYNHEHRRESRSRPMTRWYRRTTGGRAAQDPGDWQIRCYCNRTATRARKWTSSCRSHTFMPLTTSSRCTRTDRWSCGESRGAFNWICNLLEEEFQRNVINWNKKSKQSWVSLPLRFNCFLFSSQNTHSTVAINRHYNDKYTELANTTIPSRLRFTRDITTWLLLRLLESRVESSEFVSSHVPSWQ